MNVMPQRLPITKAQSIIADAIEMAGSQRALARKKGVEQCDISQALNGADDARLDRVMNALGYIVVTEKFLVPVKGQNH